MDLGPGIMYSATTIVTMLVAVFFMVQLSASLTLWVLLPVPVVAFAVRYFGETIHRLSEQIQAALGTLSTRAQENLTGVRVVRAYVQEKPEIARFDGANRDYVNRNIKLISTWSMFFPFLQALIGVTFMILLWAGGRQVVLRTITIGTFWAFFSFLVQLVWPMIALGWVTNIFQRGAASMGRLNYILTAKPQIDDRTAKLSKDARINGEIEFRNLTFAYPTSIAGNGTKGSNGQGGSARPVLKNVNLKIPAGSTLAIIGPTGSGKTTLAALIA